MNDIHDGPARIGCESCGTRHGCICDQLLMCNHCGADFLPPDEGDGDSCLCGACMDKFSEDDDDMIDWKDGEVDDAAGV